jgi:hypothetical protein
MTKLELETIIQSTRNYPDKKSNMLGILDLCHEELLILNENQLDRLRRAVDMCDFDKATILELLPSLGGYCLNYECLGKLVNLLINRLGY